MKLLEGGKKSSHYSGFKTGLQWDLSSHMIDSLAPTWSQTKKPLILTMVQEELTDFEGGHATSQQSPQPSF